MVHLSYVLWTPPEYTKLYHESSSTGIHCYGHDAHIILTIIYGTLTVQEGVFNIII